MFFYLWVLRGLWRWSGGYKDGKYPERPALQRRPRKPDAGAEPRGVRNLVGGLSFVLLAAFVLIVGSAVGGLVDEAQSGAVLAFSITLPIATLGAVLFWVVLPIWGWLHRQNGEDAVLERN